MYCNMCTMLVRPHIYFSCDVWSPYLVCDIKLEHSRLRRATKLPTALRHLPYGERLKALNFSSLHIGVGSRGAPGAGAPPVFTVTP